MTLSECINNWKQSNYSIARPSCLKQCSKLSLETDQLFHLTQSTFWIQQKFRKKYKTITGEKYYSAKNLTLLTITRKVESKWIRRMFGTARSFKASLPLDIPEWHALRKYFLVRAYHINRVLLCIRMWIKFSGSHFTVIATETIVVIKSVVVSIALSLPRWCSAMRLWISPFFVVRLCSVNLVLRFPLIFVTELKWCMRPASS